MGEDDENENANDQKSEKWVPFCCTERVKVDLLNFNSIVYHYTQNTILSKDSDFLLRIFNYKIIC